MAPIREIDTLREPFRLFARAGASPFDRPSRRDIDVQRLLALSIDGDAWAMRQLRTFLADCGPQYPTERWTDRDVFDCVSDLARSRMLSLEDPDDAAADPNIAVMQELAISHLRMSRRFTEEQIQQADLSFITNYLVGLAESGENYEHGISRLKLVISQASKLPGICGIAEPVDKGRITKKLDKLEASLETARKAGAIDPNSLNRAERCLEKVFQQLRAKKPDGDKIDKNLAEANRILGRAPHYVVIAAQMKEMARKHLKMMRKFTDEEIKKADLSFIDKHLKSLSKGRDDFVHGVSLLKMVLSSSSKLPGLIGISEPANSKDNVSRIKKLKAEIVAYRAENAFPKATLDRAAGFVDKAEKLTKKKPPDKKDGEQVTKFLNDAQKLLPKPKPKPKK